MSFKVFIPTAGIGSRLGRFTTNINKSLVSVNNKPVISHIIDSFPDSCRFVIALGYKGDLVKEFIKQIYPKKQIEFNFIDPYIGDNSGLTYTLLSSSHLLQEPFVFISCDTLITNSIPYPDHNWVAFSKNTEIDSYRTLEIKSNKVQDFIDKGKGKMSINFPYIGLCGIFDFKLFWEGLEKDNNRNINIGEVSGLRNLITKGINAYKMQWFDTGNIEALNKAREKFKSKNSPVILEKEKEAIWFLDEKVIKFSTDQEFIKNRCKRSKILTDFIPKITNQSKHMYFYKKVNGDVLSKVCNMPMFKKLLDKSEIFWNKYQLDRESRENFENVCLDFYKEKTKKRIKHFFNEFRINDQAQNINGELVPELKILIDKIDWQYLSKGIPVRFHGDFHFENILWNQDEDDFVFLDWRQDFGGILNYGDIYYDFAKLLHGLIVSHKLIEEEHFFVEWDINKINFVLHRYQKDVDFEKYFNYWCNAKGYDFNKVKVITALIYLNIAPLHHQPYNYLLFALGKLMLYRELKNNEISK